MLMRDLCTSRSLMHAYPPNHPARFMRGINHAQVGGPDKNNRIKDVVFTMHGREFCMRWIIRGWPVSAAGPEHSQAIRGSADGLGPRLAPKKFTKMSSATPSIVTLVGDTHKQNISKMPTHISFLSARAVASRCHSPYGLHVAG